MSCQLSNHQKDHWISAGCPPPEACSTSVQPVAFPMNSSWSWRMTKTKNDENRKPNHTDHFLPCDAGNNTSLMQLPRDLSCALPSQRAVLQPSAWNPMSKYWATNSTRDLHCKSPVEFVAQYFYNLLQAPPEFSFGISSMPHAFGLFAGMVVIMQLSEQLTHSFGRLPQQKCSLLQHSFLFCHCSFGWRRLEK